MLSQTPTEPVSDPDPVIEAYERTVDRALLRESLKKTPDQRVRAVSALQHLAREAREAGKRLRGQWLRTGDQAMADKSLAPRLETGNFSGTRQGVDFERGAQAALQQPTAPF